MPPPALTSMTLPGGLLFDTLCPENTRIIHEEIFGENVYDSGGLEYADGDTIFDVGANLGLFVLWLNTRLTRARVHCFEPVPQTFAGLERNVARHNRLDVVLHPVGASDRAEEVDFTFYPLTSSSSSRYPLDSPEAHADSRRFIRGELAKLGGLRGLVAARGPSWIVDRWAESIRRHYQRPETVRCRLVRLSDVIREQGVDRIDLLKVDVEGAEFEALAGLDDEHWEIVRQAVVEVHGGADAAARMTRLLADRGFRTASVQQDPEVFVRHHLIYARRPASGG